MVEEFNQRLPEARYLKGIKKDFDALDELDSKIDTSDKMLVTLDRQTIKSEFIINNARKFLSSETEPLREDVISHLVKLYAAEDTLHEVMAERMKSLGLDGVDTSKDPLLKKARRCADEIEALKNLFMKEFSDVIETYQAQDLRNRLTGER